MWVSKSVMLADICWRREDARYGIGKHFESRQVESANGSGFCFGIRETAEHDIVRVPVLYLYCTCSVLVLYLLCMHTVFTNDSLSRW